MQKCQASQRPSPPGGFSQQGVPRLRSLLNKESLGSGPFVSEVFWVRSSMFEEYFGSRILNLRSPLAQKSFGSGVLFLGRPWLRSPWLRSPLVQESFGSAVFWLRISDFLRFKSPLDQESFDSESLSFGSEVLWLRSPLDQKSFGPGVLWLGIPLPKVYSDSRVFGLQNSLVRNPGSAHLTVEFLYTGLKIILTWNPLNQESSDSGVLTKAPSDSEVL